MIKRIPGFDGYWVDENGNAYSSIKNKVDCGEPYRKISVHKLTERKRSGKRYAILMCKNRKRKFLLIHRAVALAFLPNPRNLPCVCHIDDDSSNNILSNLRWGDNKMNASDRKRNKMKDEKIRELEYEISQLKNKITIKELYAEVA